MSHPLKRGKRAGKRETVGVCFLSLIVSVAGRPVIATELALTGDAKVVEEYNTNLFRTLRPHDPAWGQGVDGQITGTATDEYWGTTANARFANRWYVDDNNLDYYNQLFNWNGYYRGQYFRWSLDGQYNMDNTLSSESDVTEDLGYVFRRIPRTTRILAPNWTYNLSERSLLNLSYQYQDRTYDKDKVPIANVVDSVSHAGGLSFQNQWNQALTLTASAHYSHYTLRGRSGTSFGVIEIPVGDDLLPVLAEINRPAVDSTIQTTSLTVGFNWAYDDTLSMGFTGGAQYNDVVSPGYSATTLINGTVPGPEIPILGAGNTALTEILAANARKRFEHSDIGFDYSRSVSPNLTGNLIAYDRYSLSGSHHIMDRLTGSLNLSYAAQSSPLEDGTTAFNRDIFSARTGLNWQWDENWAVSASYQYSQVKYPDSESADSHAIFLNMQYVFDKYKL